ncbi:MAG: hypothetical protein A07HN63_01154 [uncultured archaeon A07HN63]|nr:MAG: hypothetical protein A07HN63_01154 [uncultured archaeon A07HN63]
MEIRGQRACQSCYTEWSYYETGSIACPNCGSLQSVGLDDNRKQHTDSPAALPLSEFSDRIADDPVDQYADDMTDILREYTRKRGFITGGDLRELDDTYLVARTLLHTVDMLARERDPPTDAELYLLDLHKALTDEGTAIDDLPPCGPVPEPLTEAWGLAACDAVDAYSGDLRTWLDSSPDAAARSTLGRLRDHLKRLQALQGDVQPKTATRLVRTARDIGRYLRADDDTALATAGDRLDGF